MKTRKRGLRTQLCDPPGGVEARIMLAAAGLDRLGSGLWTSSSVLYFTVVVHLSAQQAGALLGIAGIVGVVGSPLAGAMASRISVRSLLVACHLLRSMTLILMMLCADFAALLPVVAITSLGDRAAKTLETLFATQFAGNRRGAYRALTRSVGNATRGVGAAVAAVALAVGTHTAYDALICGDALSFVVAASLVLRTRGEPRPMLAGEGRACESAGAENDVPASGRSGPWRDRSYLLFVLLDIPLNLDDSVINVGIPLWLAQRTSAPHALVPAFLIANTVMVVLLQLLVSTWARGPRGTVRAVFGYGSAMFMCCAVVAAAPEAGKLTAAGELLVAVLWATAAELMRSVSSWELSVLLSPQAARERYLGLAGMSQSIQKSAGPPLLTGLVIGAGPVGWVTLGAGITLLSVIQGVSCARKLRCPVLGSSGPMTSGSG